MIWIIYFIVVLLMFSCIDWFTHIIMNKKFPRKYGWASYNKFKETFERYEWIFNDDYKYSCWDENTNSEFHANLVKFEGKHMILRTPIEWYLVKRYVKNILKELEQNCFKKLNGNST